MKKIILASLLAFGLAFAGRAQTNTTPQQTFFNSIGSYFTSMDTNSTTFHKANEFDVSLGADYVNNANVSSSLNIRYGLYALGTNGLTLGLESVTRNAGIAGVIQSQQLGLTLSKAIYDVKITGFLEPGYNFPLHHSYAEIGAEAAKALTPNTYSFIRLGTDISARNNGSVVVSGGVGFTF